MTNADKKSMEEKQEAYDRAKARIFSQEVCMYICLYSTVVYMVYCMTSQINPPQSRNGSRPQQQQSLLSDAAEAVINNPTNDHSDVKFPPEELRDDTSPGSRSRSSSQGSSSMSSSRNTPSRNRLSNRRPPQPKSSPRQQQPYIQAGNYMAAGYVSHSVGIYVSQDENCALSCI